MPRLWLWLLTPVLLSQPVPGQLERVRQVNLDYAANMPNFVADETAKRYSSNKRSPQWRFEDTIETEIGFTGNRVARQKVRRNGKPWEQPFEQLPGFKWTGGFGSEIRPLFDPECSTTVEYVGRSEERGRRLLKYRFQSPAQGCFAYFYYESQQYNPARTGHALVDEANGHLMQLDEDASEFPEGFGFARRDVQVNWDYVAIGDDLHLLPVSASFVAMYSSGARWRVDVEFTNHRHFEASTNLTFH